ncbi:hypothetical protein MK786_09680 [Microbacterium sp. CFH 31415]|uniref:hypothetical protein n=1 Tax=Microbacterium sp. CFH 31415 TaxID=2921732 RepID=UPI001F12C53E|nr:hypothetical protein [Microbacterium sp. CFH 31415]MCH6231005.1 hypothetical protein [Microbacterium sp. CFH 31415]
MTVPDPHAPVQPQAADAPVSSLLRAAIWVAIGALIASAVVCVVWVLVGDQSDIIGKAFLTILLLVAFAGVTILDAHLAPRRPAWFALASMGTWILTLLIGAVLIWMPERYSWDGFTRFVQFLFIVLILQLALLHVRLYTKALQRYDTPFTRTVAVITIVLVAALVVLLILPLMFDEYLRFPDIYWRIVVAVAILAAVGTALIPLVNVLFAPKKPRAAAYPAYGAMPAAAPAPAPGAQQELLPWPNYVDGVTPLPMLPDGSPDWNAYYTGYPSPGAHVFGAPQAAPQGGDTQTSASAIDNATPPPHPGYEGYPPPPPLPPQR